MSASPVNSGPALVRAKRTRRGALAAAGIVALCCATPALVVALGAVGLGAWRGKVDLVVWPLLAVAVIAVWLAHERVVRCESAGCQQGKESQNV